MNVKQAAGESPRWRAFLMKVYQAAKEAGLDTILVAGSAPAVLVGQHVVEASLFTTIERPEVKQYVEDVMRLTAVAAANAAQALGNPSVIAAVAAAHREAAALALAEAQRRSQAAETLPFCGPSAGPDMHFCTPDDPLHPHRMGTVVKGVCQACGRVFDGR